MHILQDQEEKEDAVVVAVGDCLECGRLVGCFVDVDTVHVVDDDGDGIGCFDC